jgi:hypothetical protein
LGGWVQWLSEAEAPPRGEAPFDDLISLKLKLRLSSNLKRLGAEFLFLEISGLFYDLFPSIAVNLEISL